MALKRYKVVMNTAAGVKTTICEAVDEKDAEKKSLATLENWMKPATADVEEVGKELRRTMP